MFGKWRWLLPLTAICVWLGAAEPDAFWIWSEKPPVVRSTRYFRLNLRLPDHVKSAPVAFACDDAGKVYVNGFEVKNNQNQKANQQNWGDKLCKGDNVIAFSVYNALNPAGVILRGEVLLEDGRVVQLRSDDLWLGAAEAPAGWNTVGFDDSTWAKTVKLGPPEMPPFDKLTDGSLFYPPQKVTVAPERLGLLMLDDFADISSWLGGPGPGATPGSAHPFEFNFGSVPAPERDDNWCGELHFDTAEPRGMARFSKNSILLLKTAPQAIGFAADANGNAGEVVLVFVDRFAREFVAKPIRLSGKSWQNYRVELNAQTVPEWDKVSFPVVLRELRYLNDVPAKGSIRLDDLYYISDISDPARQLAMHPDFKNLNLSPNTPGAVTYRVRNGRHEAVDASFELCLYDVDRKLLARLPATEKIPAYGFGRVTFELPAFAKKGAYAMELTGDNGKVKTVSFGWLGVFEPNGKRINHAPMWFGIEDQEVNTAPYEAKLHVAWMKLLGVDMMRGGLLGHKAEGVRGGTTGYEGFRRMWQPHVDAGLDICLDYAGAIPAWAKGNPALSDPAARPLGNDPALFREHIEHLGQFMNSIPQIKYFEWFNEPNLSHVDRDGYMASMRQLYPVLKRTAPNVKVGTGGLVVAPHPAAIPGFLQKNYVENSDCYDIAFYHAHDGFASYQKITRELQQLAKGKPFANTETGYRSYYTSPDMFYGQARVLFQKIAWSRAAGMEFYIWFMLQDYHDKYPNADDSFGLVTVDNQPKPSFVVYNELIRQLADTVPAGDAALDPRLEGCRFQKDGEEIVAAWPRRDNHQFSFCLQSNVPVTLIDCFGNQEILSPVNGVIFVNTPRYPFYLRAAAGGLKPVGELVSLAGNTVLLPGSANDLVLTVRNPFALDTVCKLTVAGRTFEESLGPLAQKSLRMRFELPEATGIGTKSLAADVNLLTSDGKILYTGQMQLPYCAALPVSTAAAARPMVLDQEKDLTELVFDPTTPRWSGREDLSAELRLSVNGDVLQVDAVVRDQDHRTPREGVMNWINDSIQFAVANARNEHYEFTVSGGPGSEPIFWCHLSPDDKMPGAQKLPLTVRRDGDLTRYMFQIPLAQIGVKNEPGAKFRIAVAVNDNDGGKRLRLMTFGGGIEGSKDISLFEWCVIR